MKKRIVLMASGTGSLAQAVIDAVQTGDIDAQICAIITDQPQARVIERARDASITTFVHPMKKDRPAWNSELIAYVDSLRPDLVVSVGFMRILSPEFVSRFPTINSHPSLLPSFPGAHAVADALKAGVNETGTTVHWVDEGVDTGKVIAQVRVPVLNGDDEATLHERIKIVERELVVETIKKVLPEINPPANNLEN
jgi:phosphoribosylglycinamide formyltransferase-1